MSAPTPRAEPPDDLPRRLATALDAAQQAGEAALKRYHSGDFTIDAKRDATPVTEADREAESLARAIIARAYPHDAILGEEHADQPGSTNCRWIIDPIDGTQSFIRNVPLWGTLIALETINDDGSTNPPSLGVVHMPALNETVYAALGQGAWHLSPNHRDPKPARVSAVASPEEGLVTITGYNYFRDAGCPQLHDALLKDFRHSRGWSDCYAHVLIATGRADACIEPTLAVWDIAAAYPIIHEAGGRCTSMTGTEDPRAGSAIISNGPLHDQLLRIIAAR